MSVSSGTDESRFKPLFPNVLTVKMRVYAHGDACEGACDCVAGHIHCGILFYVMLNYGKPCENIKACIKTTMVL